MVLGAVSVVDAAWRVSENVGNEADGEEEGGLNLFPSSADPITKNCLGSA